MRLECLFEEHKLTVRARDFWNLEPNVYVVSAFLSFVSRQLKILSFLGLELHKLIVGLALLRLVLKSANFACHLFKIFKLLFELLSIWLWLRVKNLFLGASNLASHTLGYSVTLFAAKGNLLIFAKHSKVRSLGLDLLLLFVTLTLAMKAKRSARQQHFFDYQLPCIRLSDQI